MSADRAAFSLATPVISPATAARRAMTLWRASTTSAVSTPQAAPTPRRASTAKAVTTPATVPTPVADSGLSESSRDAAGQSPDEVAHRDLPHCAQSRRTPSEQRPSGENPREGPRRPAGRGPNSHRRACPHTTHRPAPSGSCVRSNARQAATSLSTSDGSGPRSDPAPSSTPRKYSSTPAASAPNKTPSTPCAPSLMGAHRLVRHTPAHRTRVR
ncbi:hypothetical protein SAMN04489731_101667 [Amycolatopsis regifaucium]|nr:hypothetical protein SAMN04489731_101667 [Amycolatopsis regifaucium]